jgi:hypothetical protein
MFTPGSRACGYKTVSGRHEWPNRDPIGEWGGINLYRYVANNPIDRIDPLGLWQITIEGGVFWGGQITFGNNGGSGIFNGQWNLGVHAGFGEGLAFSLDPKNSGCHSKGFSDTGLRLDGTVKGGPLGIALSGDVTKDGGKMDVGLDTGTAHMTIPLLNDGVPVTTPIPVIGFGEGATLSLGSTYYFR